MSKKFAISPKDSKAFYMAGTENTGSYVVLANSGFGRVGVRYLADGTVRVRVEPSNEIGAGELAAILGEGWKQPGDGGQPRFSRVVKQDELRAVVQTVLDRLAEGKLVANPAAPAWVSDCIRTAEFNASMEQNKLAIQAGVLKLPGSNFADRWTVRTLRAKVAAVPADVVRTTLVAQVKAMAVKGANLASTWPTAALWRKACGLTV